MWVLFYNIFWIYSPFVETQNNSDHAVTLSFLLQWDFATGWTSHGGGGTWGTGSYRAQSSHDKWCQRGEDDHKQTVSNGPNFFVWIQMCEIADSKEEIWQK